MHLDMMEYILRNYEKIGQVEPKAIKTPGRALHKPTKNRSITATANRPNGI